MVTGLLAYIMNYIIGKNKNSRLAQAWFNSHRELLESNFALVGEFFHLLTCLQYTTAKMSEIPEHLFCPWVMAKCMNGHSQYEVDLVLTVNYLYVKGMTAPVKNQWALGSWIRKMNTSTTCGAPGVCAVKACWSSSRYGQCVLCIGVCWCHIVLNIQLYNVPWGLFQFLKRQDLLNVLARMMRPVCDQVVCICHMSLRGDCEVEHCTASKSSPAVTNIVLPTASVCL